MNEEEKNKKKQEALIDYNLAKTEIKKSNIKYIKHIFIVMLIMLVLAVVIRVFYGRIYISNSVLKLNKSVEHNLYINGKNYNVSFEDNEDFPIIPGLFYFRRSNSGVWYNIDRLNENIILDDEKTILEFKSNECYTHTDEVRVACDSANYKLLKKEIEPKFTRLFIRKNSKNESIKYDGEFINDISKYVSEKGYYYIEVYAQYDGIDTKLVFFPRRLKDV